MSKHDMNTILGSLVPYRIEERRVSLTKTILGRGGFGVVILGELDRSFWTSRSGTPVAVKQLHAPGTAAETEKLALALVQELHVWAGLAHPHIIHLLGFFLSDRMDRAWLISPYMKNGNIRTYLAIRKPDMNIRLRMLADIASAIVYLHLRNLCHGDVKGANVLVDDCGHVKLCDFGLTELMENESTGGTTSTGPKGTTRYMAPELFHEARQARSKKSDVWAWSCLGSEILFDRVPYGDVKVDSAVMLRIVRGDLPLDVDSTTADDGIKKIFTQCWTSRPEERADIKACAIAVEGVLDERCNLLHNSALSRRGDLAGLNETIDLLRQVLRLRPEGHPERHHSLHTLAATLTNKYRWEKSITDCDEVIDLHRQALRLRPVGHMERADSLHGLAITLQYKYDKDAEVANLDEAINFHRQALVVRSKGHSDRRYSLHPLGLALEKRSQIKSNNADLVEAMVMLQEALALTPTSDPTHRSIEATLDKIR